MEVQDNRVGSLASLYCLWYNCLCCVNEGFCKEGGLPSFIAGTAANFTSPRRLGDKAMSFVFEYLQNKWASATDANDAAAKANWDDVWDNQEKERQREWVMAVREGMTSSDRLLQPEACIYTSCTDDAVFIVHITLCFCAVRVNPTSLRLSTGGGALVCQTHGPYKEPTC